MGSATTSRSNEIAVTSVRVERTKLDELAAIAKSNQRSVSQEIRWLIDQHLAAARVEQARA